MIITKLRLSAWTVLFMVEKTKINSFGGFKFPNWIRMKHCDQPNQENCTSLTHRQGNFHALQVFNGLFDLTF